MKSRMLTEGQQRALEVGLRIIELELAWLEELLDWGYEGATVSLADDLSDSRLEGLRESIREAFALIRGLRDNLDLRPDRISKSAWIAGHLARLWAPAEESQSRYLRGYGKVAPDLPARLDPVASRLAELLLAMQRLARAGQVEEVGRVEPVAS